MSGVRRGLRRTRFPTASDNSRPTIVRRFIAPGKPMRNGCCESFNGRMPDELLNESRFANELELSHFRPMFKRRTWRTEKVQDGEQFLLY